jgi:dipeptidyl aminopeptidase/acylaminoacyl peptidase
MPSPALHPSAPGRLRSVAALLLFALSAPSLSAQGVGEEGGYRLPPAEIVAMLDAPRAPGVTLNPERSWMILVHSRNLPTLLDLSEPMLGLAGRRINPRTHGAYSPTLVERMTLREVATGNEREIPLPDGGGWSAPSFSPDGTRYFFTRTTDSGIEGWTGTVAEGTARRLVAAPLNGARGTPCGWMPDSRSLLCHRVPDGLGAPPEAPRIPVGPAVQESSGDAGIIRTYQDLLSTPHDEALYEHFLTSQPVVVDVATGSETPLGPAAIYAEVTPSPSGEYVLSVRRVRPWSYLLPESFFPRESEIRNRSGEVVLSLGSTPLADNLPAGGVAPGPRSHGWMAGAPHTLRWVEGLDGGDPRIQVAQRDRIMALAAPFSAEASELLRTEHRFQSLTIGSGGTGILLETDRPTRMVRAWRVDLQREGGAPELLWERNSEDRYGDPGTPVLELDSRGDAVLLQDGDWIFLRGAGASPEGDRPFLERFNLRTGAREPLFRSPDGAYETVEALLDRRGERILTRHESPDSPPNYFIRELSSGQRAAVTAFADPAPSFADVRREFLSYERADGVQLSATLYLPPDYQEGERRPALVWAYPREFSTPEVAGQVTGSPYRFTRPSGSSHLFLLTQGYVILDDAAMPIVGGDLANDSYLEQLVASASAAVEVLVERGVADRDRIGVGGHSYGAFMTANLLAHSDLFRAGIARSGAYNRTLTPFGFQNETRTFWEATEVYAEMSPFFHAAKINEPVLFVHGMNDNNSGTFPIQSERMFHAVKGLGGTARLVMLPFESHGYAARESILHTIAETLEWLDRYVKNAAPRPITEDR